MKSLTVIIVSLAMLAHIAVGAAHTLTSAMYARADQSARF